MPASAIAWSAAASAKRCDRFAYLSSFRSSSGGSRSTSFTSAAIRVEKPEASNSVIGAAQLRAAFSRSHVDVTSSPAGVTRPMPVIATRRRAVMRFPRMPG